MLTDTISNNNQRHRGFTLLELLLVLVIASALAGLMVPQFEKILTSVRFDQKSRALQNLLLQSGLKAQREGRTIQLDIDTNGIREGENLLLNLQADTELVMLDKWNQQLDGGLLRFYSDGSTSGGQLLLKQQQRQHRFRINWLTGVISHERAQ